MNNSIDFKGTNKIFLDIRREVLPGDTVICKRCEKGTGPHYWKFGIIDETKRAHVLCDTCHREIS